MRVTIEEVLPIKPNILRVKAYTLSDPNADEPILVNYELAIHTQDFVTVSEGEVQINIDLFKGIISRQIWELQNTANLGRAIELANLAWDVEVLPQEPLVKDGKTLAYGEDT